MLVVRSRFDGWDCFTVWNWSCDIKNLDELLHENVLDHEGESHYIESSLYIKGNRRSELDIIYLSKTLRRLIYESSCMLFNFNSFIKCKILTHLTHHNISSTNVRLSTSLIQYQENLSNYHKTIQYCLQF